MEKDEDLLKAIDAAEAISFGSDSDGQLQRDRSRAIEFYLGKNIDPAPEGRSQVVDRSVFETIQWIMPSLCRIFANGDDIVELVPFGPEDEEQAKQESDYLNYLVTQKNRWFDICTTWFHDALETKNAYCLVYMDESMKVEKERYENQTEQAITMLSQEDGVEIISMEEFIDNDSMQPVIDPNTGGPAIDETGQPMMQPSMLYNVEIRRTKPKKHLCFQVLPPERCKISENTPSHTLEHCDYFEYWEFKTISQLRAEGFDVPDDIASEDGRETEEDWARDQYAEENTRYDSPSINDPSMKRVRARMIWIRYDYDDDGIAELQRVLRVGQRVLYREEESRIPVSSIVPYPNPHRHIGLSVSDIVADIQRIRTAILRGGLDNLYLANNPRTVINEKINLDDMLVSRPGGVVRSEGEEPVTNNYAVIATPNVFPQAMEGLEYMDRIKESRTGVSRQFAGIENDTLLEAKSATEASQLSTMAAQRVEQIARIFASGVEYLFSIAHELVLKHGHKSDTVKLRNQWVEVNPSQWRTGRDMRIVVGYGAGNKDALAARLMKILAIQKEAISGGLRIASEKNIYEAVVELTKASDFTAPQRFWTDPATLPPAQPPPDPNMEAVKVEAERVQSTERVKAAELQQRDKAAEVDAAVKKYIAELDAEVKVYLKQIENGGQVNLEEVRQRFKNEPITRETQKIEEHGQMIKAISEANSQQTEKLANLIESLAETVKTMNGPKRVVRDKSGRVAGVELAR